MPTAAKLVAAFAFAMLGFATCLVLREVMPESLRVGRMFEAAVLCGALSGWMISGRARRGSLAEAAATGLRATSVGVLSALVLLAVGAMIKASLRGRYRGPMDAVLDVFERFVDYGSALLAVPVLGMLFFGGMLAGMVTEAAGRRWR